MRPDVDLERIPTTPEWERVLVCTLSGYPPPIPSRNPIGLFLPPPDKLLRCYICGSPLRVEVRERSA